MTEAVIVAYARTPIGRANKGSLVDCRPDDLSALIIKSVLERVPQLDAATVEDVIWGCGQPAGEAGTNIARVAGIGRRRCRAGGARGCQNTAAEASCVARHEHRLQMHLAR